MKLLVIHGPNLPYLGKVSSKKGSRFTLDKVNTLLRREALRVGLDLKIYQIFDESHMLKTISRNRYQIEGLIIAPGAGARGLYALRELLSLLALPVVEVHLNEYPDAEDAYQHSVLGEISAKRILAPAETAFVEALQFFCVAK
jgi:3-dehydroquinate dehydratase-2